MCGQYDALVEAIAEIDKAVDAAIAKMDAEMAAGQATFRSLIALLCTIPGVSDLAARTILAEIGTDMGRFPTAGHLLSWAGLCPGQNESAGKRKSSRMRKGTVRLRGHSQEGQLLQGAVQPLARQARREEGDLRRGRFDALGNLPHAEVRHRTPGSRRQPLRPSLDRDQS
jgi:transposase